MAKVAMVVTKAEFGGAQEYLRILMASMRQHEVVLITGDSGFLTDAAADMGITVRVCPHLVHPVRPLEDMKAIAHMVRLLRQEKPDLVHANSSKAGIVARIAALLAGVPAIFTAHGWAFTEGVGSKRARFFRWIEAFAAPLTKKIICVSDYDKNLAIANRVGRTDRLLTVHNGIPDIPDCLAGHINPIPRFAMVARFSVPKDYETLLHAVSLIKSLPFKLQCVGDGPLLEESRQLAARLGVLDKVEFLGARKDVPAILKNADVFVLVSNWEGLPLSVLEGMRAGLPVVATRVGGVPEAVSDQVTGLLVPPRDSAALAKAFTRMITGPLLRREMGRAGRERYLAMFTADRMIARTVEVYDAVLMEAERRVLVSGKG